MQLKTRVFQKASASIYAVVAAFFGKADTWLGHWVVRLILVGQFILGFVVWGTVLNWGTIPFDTADWQDVTAPRLELIQQAVIQSEVPLHTASTAWAKGATDRFFAVPDLILSPQVLLLRWLPPGTFVLVQVWLLYCIGFWGMLRLRRKYHLSLAAFLPLAWLFFFNGHIVDHMTVGHLTWAGYFLLPFMVELVLELGEANGPIPAGSWGARVAILQGALFLQGGFHLFTLNLILLAIMLVFYWRQWRPLLTAIAASLLVCMVRILPAAMSAQQLDINFSSGFTTLNELFNGLVVLKPIAQALDSITAITPQIGWWEFDFYVGWSGLLWLVLFGIYFIAKNKNSGKNYRPLLAISGILGIFSIGRVYNLVFILQIPLINGERVTSRFFVLPLLIIGLLAAIGMQRWLDEHPGKNAAYFWIYLGLFVILVSDLRQHYELWKVNNLGELFAPIGYALPMEIANHSDPVYVSSLVIGAAISALSLVGTAGLWLLSENQITKLKLRGKPDRTGAPSP